MLISMSSSVSRTPTPGGPEREDTPLATVHDLADRRAPATDLPPTSELHITRELLVALGGRWAPRD